MPYEFSFGSFFVGFLIVAIGVAFMRWHRVLADNFGSGVASYDKARLWALITVLLGFVVSINLHWFIIGNLARMIFRADT
ncbi:hypothetical protein HGB25_02505 [Candidatus Saccharibacteria bacterium]|nr:hypothetical protein [Candidatus Saccharibacteria bacterium]